MYKKQFCVCIKDAKRNPIQEHDGLVTMPFDSEYFISLQNKHQSKRALVSVIIDGSKAAEVVIPPEDRLDLERFLTGENLSNGPRFKFVSLNDENVVDPGYSKNGIIEVSVQFEKENIPSPVWVVPQVIPFKWYVPFYIPYVPYTPLHNPWCTWTVSNASIPTCSNDTVSVSSAGSSATGGTYYTSTNANLVNNNSVDKCSNLDNSQLGATVKGSDSKQAFSTTTVGCLDEDIIYFKIRMVAPKENQGPKEGFCVNCGGAVKHNHKFCSNCGKKIGG